jgi:hypothetical protein
MVDKNDRLKLLEKVAAGELSVGDAADLLNAARTATDAPTPPPAEEAAPKAMKIKIEDETPSATPGNGKTARWLRVRVNDLKTGEPRVSVNIPVRLMKFGMRIGSRFAPELADFDVDELTGMMGDMESGLLVDVRDEKDGEHVQIFVD